MDSIQMVAGTGCLQYLQHYGGAGFMAAVRSTAAAQLSVDRLPTYFPEEGLAQVIGQYGKAKAVGHGTFRDGPGIRTRTRVVKMDMFKPVPKFISVQGHRVMVDYRGLRRVCSRCGKEGHFGHVCKTPHCDRCGLFDHAKEGCTTPCLKQYTAENVCRCHVAAQGLSVDPAVANPPSNPRMDKMTWACLPNNRLCLCTLVTHPSCFVKQDRSGRPRGLRIPHSVIYGSRFLHSSDRDRLPQFRLGPRFDKGREKPPAKLAARIRFVLSGGARTHLMFEYLGIFRDRHLRHCRTNLLMILMYFTAFATRAPAKAAPSFYRVCVSRITSFVRTPVTSAQLSENSFLGVFRSDPAFCIGTSASQVRSFCCNLLACHSDLDPASFAIPHARGFLKPSEA
ncbi:hypothetical protein HPB47_000101 [Ixodes persulcatus]|uniref:Uncharacterized protein n=1 Tax=Ixodes persulcatus TaxID=34615 RepID=A0AC60PSQ2_IXOPE|nr:hypothetical protein HPB47_000101 [Ixodes persulcatus]